MSGEPQDRDIITNDDASLTSHFRLTRDPDGWAYEVGTVEWPEPSEPVTVWIPFRRWKR